MNRKVLSHRTIYESSEDQEIVKLPFISELREYHENGEFPILENPNTYKRSVIIGMFVLRPGMGKACDGEFPECLYDEQCDWVYNLDGIDGGWIVANLNSVDAYRLGLQYALSDAVMVGSNTVCAEGITTADRPGYLWQPYSPFSWPSVSKHDPNMLEKALKQRAYWQQLGFLSSRRQFPAQIIITNSGNRHENSLDFLCSDTLTAKHPNGDPFEVYILTTQIGARRITERCHQSFPHLLDRLDSLLIVLPSLPESPERMDLQTLPSLLYEKLEMKIINHDGGRQVLSDFARQGILTQMNLTLGKKITLREVLEQLPEGIVSEELRKKCLEEISVRTHYFFRSCAKEADEGKILHSIPRSLPLVYAIEDEAKDVLIATFKTKHGYDFYSV